MTEDYSSKIRHAPWPSVWLGLRAGLALIVVVARLTSLVAATVWLSLMVALRLLEAGCRLADFHPEFAVGLTLFFALFALILYPSAWLVWRLFGPTIVPTLRSWGVAGAFAPTHDRQPLSSDPVAALNP